MEAIEDSNRARPVRIACSGLLAEDARAFADLVNESSGISSGRWKLVDSELDVCVVDPGNRNAIPILRELPVGAVVVFAYATGAGAPPPAYLSVARPFRYTRVVTVLRQAEERLHRLWAAEAQAQQERDAAGTPPDSGLESTIIIESDDAAVVQVDSLAELARHLNAYSASGLVCVESLQFALDEAAGLYYSTSKASDLSRFRARLNLSIRILPSRCVRVGANLAPRRLDAFLWELGLSAGNGRLLPEIDQDSSFQISRWPPLTGTQDRSLFFQVSAAIARAPTRPQEISRLTGTPLEKVYDFLNACWLVDCLDIKPAEGAMHGHTVAETEPKLASVSLFGLVRSRLGM
jgi:hypothetical protein